MIEIVIFGKLSKSTWPRWSGAFGDAFETITPNFKQFSRNVETARENW